MRSSNEMYKEVACRCSAYDRNKKTGCACNDTSDKSCLNCNHFTSGAYCELDLYDSIAKNIQK